MSMHERDVFRQPSSREQQEKEEAEKMPQKPATEDETKATEKDEK